MSESALFMVNTSYISMR